MTLNLSRVITGLALCLVAACGAPGAYDLCSATCDAFKKCGYSNEVDTTNCHTDCTNKQGTYNDQDNQLAKDCKNSGDIRKSQLNCYDSTSCRGNSVEYSVALASCVSDPPANQCIRP